MEGVSFEEDRRYVPAPLTSTNAGGVAGLVLRLGLAKDAKSAQQVMIAIIVLALIALGFIWFLGGSEGASVTTDDYEARTQNVNPVPARR